MSYYVDHHHDDRCYTKAEVDSFSGSHWINVNASVSRHDPHDLTRLAGTTVVRPPSVPTGSYCIK